MSLKLNILAENTKELPKPKNVRSINVDTIAEKYAYQANEKGVSGLSNFFNYFITDEWVEIEKPNKERLPENKRYYLGLITILFDKQTGEPVKKGGISLNKWIPTIYSDISGNRLNLCITGVRAYNHENLMSKKGAEHFSVAIGFRNQVCCNLCTFTDGYRSDLRAMNHYDLLTGTNKSSYIDNFLDRSLNATQLTE